MKTKNEYIESLAGELKEWSAQIDLLSAKAKETAGMARLKYVQEVNSLRSSQRAATQKMLDLENASDDAWEQVKVTSDKVWQDLRSGMASAAAKFQ